MNQYAISGFINAVSVFVLGSLVYFKNPKKEINIRYALFCLFCVFWSSFYFLWQISQDKNSALFWSRALMAGAIFIPICFLHFVLLLLDLYEKRKKVIVIGYWIFLLFFALDFTPWFIRDVGPKMSFNFWPEPGQLFAIFLLVWFWYCLYPCYLLIRDYKKFTGLKRQQIKYVLVGILIGYGSGSTNYFLWYNIPIPPYGNFIVPLFVGLMAYAVIRFRLMDINVVLTRAGIFIIVYSFVLGIPFGLAGWRRSWLINIFGQNWFWIPMLLLLVLATSGPFIYLFLQRKAENRLLREQRRRQEVVIRASETFTLIKRISRLLRYIGLLVTTALKINYAAIFLFDKRNSNYVLSNLRGKVIRLIDPTISPDAPLIKYLQEHSRNLLLYEEIKEKSSNSNLENNVKEIEAFMHNISAHLIIPSFIKDKLVGIMILGSKTSGEIYTHDDIITFKIMAGSAALAIEYAQFLKEFEEFQAKLREAEKLKGIAQLMHSLNHELLNLFNKMSMPIQLIMMGDINPNDKVTFENTLKTINDAMETSIEILGYITSYRNKSKSQESKLTKIEETIDSAINRFSKKFQEANIQIIKNIQPNLPAVQAKETFDELFINILANSYFALIDKTQGERLIEIHAGLSEDKNSIQIKMSDTGPDMTKSTYMCDKDSPFKERGKIGGVNFGLAYLITNQHDGTLTVESYEKGGTTFIIEIPINPDFSIEKSAPSLPAKQACEGSLGQIRENLA